MILPQDQKPRMLAGELYLANDPVLVAERRHAQTLSARYNATAADAEDERRALLDMLLGAVGAGVVIMPNLCCDYGYNIRIGAGSFLNYDCVLLDCAAIAIGAEVQMAPGVHLYTATHPIDPVQRRTGWEYARPITIGDGAWLGGGTIVCPGVTIGENTVVGAGSVVTRDLPAAVVAAGNPCRVLRPISPG